MTLSRPREAWLRHMQACDSAEAIARRIIGPVALDPRHWPGGGHLIGAAFGDQARDVAGLLRHHLRGRAGALQVDAAQHGTRMIVGAAL